MDGDIWAINPTVSNTTYRAAATIAADALTLTLLTDSPALNGAGYLVNITSNGNDAGITFTVTGRRVGSISSGDISEVITGPNSATVTGTIPFASITSIVASGASVNNVSIGTTGNLFLPRARIKGFYVLCSAAAGSLVVRINSVDSVVNTIFNISTPAGATLVEQLQLPGQGILTARQTNDFAEVIPTNITDYTLFCG